MANGWWGDTPPFRMPVFVLTHHPREPLVLGDTTFFFVTDGVEGEGATGPDDDLIKEQIAQPGAVLMGRRMFSGGEGAWEDDPMANGWWGDTPPFHMSVFVLTHHAREPLVLGDTTFFFATDGVESALEQARAAAGEKDVAVAGGANVVQQCLRAGLLDELQVHIAPVLLGRGVRLFADGEQGKLEIMRVVGSPTVTHIKYRVVRA